MQIKLKPGSGPVIIVAEGAIYYREFECEAQPFEVSDAEWPTLDRTGLFEIVGAGLAPPAGTAK